jgi:hypothetical protein
MPPQYRNNLPYLQGGLVQMRENILYWWKAFAGFPPMSLLPAFAPAATLPCLPVWGAALLDGFPAIHYGLAPRKANPAHLELMEARA